MKMQEKRGEEKLHKIKKEPANIGKTYICEFQKLVPVTGLEPVRCRQRWILSPLRLPFHHTGRCVIQLLHQPPLAFFIVAAYRQLDAPIV